MRICKKLKEVWETYRCKLGIHAWVTEHWWELRQRPRNILTRKGGRKRAQYYKKYRTRTYCRICGKKRRMRTKKVKVVKDRWTDGLALEISHNGWQTTSIINLDLEDLKRIRKVIRKAIREHENNKSV